MFYGISDTVSAIATIVYASTYSSVWWLEVLDISDRLNPIRFQLFFKSKKVMLPIIVMFLSNKNYMSPYSNSLS